jgi:hypothetical protein
VNQPFRLFLIDGARRQAASRVDRPSAVLLAFVQSKRFCAAFRLLK